MEDTASGVSVCAGARSVSPVFLATPWAGVLNSVSKCVGGGVQDEGGQGWDDYELGVEWDRVWDGGGRIAATRNSLRPKTLLKRTLARATKAHQRP